MIDTVLFEGVDRVGKSSLVKMFNKKTKYRYLVFDRGIISYICYAKIHDRKKSMVVKNFFSNLENTIVVHVDAPNNAITRRLIDTSHEMIDIKKHKEIFDRVFTLLPQFNVPYIKLNNEYRQDMIANTNAIIEEIRILNG